MRTAATTPAATTSHRFLDIIAPAISLTASARRPESERPARSPASGNQSNGRSVHQPTGAEATLIGPTSGMWDLGRSSDWTAEGSNP